MKRSLHEVYEEWLVLRSQAGDAEAFADLASRWQGRLWQHAARLVGCEQAADVVQESWLAIVKGIANLDDPACFPRWAYRMVTNKSADWIRKRQRDRKATDHLVHIVQQGDGSGRVVESSPSRRLRQALAELPDEQRVLLSLFYLEGLSTQALAEVFGVPVGTIKSRLFHARSTLRTAMEEQE